MVIPIGRFTLPSPRTKADQAAGWLEPAAAGGDSGADDGGLGDRRRAGADSGADDGGLGDRRRAGSDGGPDDRDLGDGRADDADAPRDLVRAACQTPCASSASSASTAAMMAWMGMRPLAMSWPPARRMAEANGAAHRFS